MNKQSKKKQTPPIEEVFAKIAVSIIKYLYKYRLDKSDMKTILRAAIELIG